MQWAVNISILIASFFTMEFIGWAMHKFLMHGVLWHIHEDHHKPKKGFFQKNDTFSLIFAIPSWLFMMFGIMDGGDYKMWIGIGIAIYGLAYAFVHEVVIHKRIKFFRNIKHPYLKGLLRAHQAHHKQKHKQDGECFGMLIVPRKYFQSAGNTK